MMTKIQFGAIYQLQFKPSTGSHEGNLALARQVEREINDQLNKKRNEGLPPNQYSWGYRCVLAGDEAQLDNLYLLDGDDKRKYLDEMGKTLQAASKIYNNRFLPNLYKSKKVAPILAKFASWTQDYINKNKQSNMCGTIVVNSESDFTGYQMPDIVSD